MSDPLNTHYDRARAWFDAEQRSWATCPVTENGFVRILSHPAYPGRPGGADVALGLLAEQRKLEGWRFWPDDISILEILEADIAIANSQITDVYLLGLAARNGGMLATLDSRINATAVRGGREALFLIPVG